MDKGDHPDVETLTVWANEPCSLFWSVRYTGNIKLTRRLWTRKNGQFKMFDNPRNITPVIEMSTKRNAERTDEEIKGTLLHELVHWRLFTQKIPHRDINMEFIAECIRVGAPISKSDNAQRAYHRYIDSVKEASHG